MSNVIDFQSYKRIRNAQREIEDIGADNGFTQEEVAALLNLCYSQMYDPKSCDYDVDTNDKAWMDLCKEDSMDTWGFTLTVNDDEGFNYD